jgi:hypothetical protein
MDWTETPQPGMLVQFGKLWIITSADCKPEYYAALVKETTPLAPAPSQCAKLWDALRFMADGDDRLRLDRGTVRWSSDGSMLLYRPDMDFLDGAYYAAHMRDMQRFGALLAYCKQWEVA